MDSHPFSRRKKDTIRNRSIKKEKKISKDLKIKLQPGSGCRKEANLKGDLSSSNWIIEHKFTDKKSYNLSVNTLLKVNQEARQNGKESALIIEFTGVERFREDKYVLISYKKFRKDYFGEE